MMEIADGPRRPDKQVRRFLRGTGMVTPIRPIEVTYEGRRERLVPNRSRLVPGHEIVRRNPELFVARDKSDRRTVQTLQRMRSQPQRSSRGAGPKAHSSYGLAVDTRPGRASWEL